MHGAACAGMSAKPKPKVSNALTKPEKISSLILF
jgi:hypothetical protein